MDIDLGKLNYKFSEKPLLVGGKAMEYYGLRKSGEDIDLIAAETDVLNLIRMYPKRVKHLWGDLGVCPFEFEIWRTICLYDYSYLKRNAIELPDYLIISKEMLLFMKALAMKKEKYLKDSLLILESIFENQTSNLIETISKNEEFLDKINGIAYLEKSGPGDK